MPIKNFMQKYPIQILISISLLFFLIYTKFDNTPPHWDSGRHYYDATKYWEWLKAMFTSTRENGRLDAAVSFFRSYLYYPPFVYWVSLPFQAVFGRTYQAALASNFVWLLTLSLATNAWLKKLDFGVFARVVCLSFLLGSPFIIGQSREFQVDLPLLAMIMITFWSLERLIQKFNLRNILLFSFIFCLGVMTKWSFGLFIIPGLIVYITRFVYLSWKYKQIKFSDISFGVYTFILSIFGICSVWYLPNIVRLKLDLFQNSTTAGLNEGDPQGFSFASFVYYVNVIVNQYLWLPWLLFFVGLVGLIVFFFHKDKINFREIFGKNRLTFALLLAIINFLFMYIYLMKQGNKDTRYAIILYPSLILFLAVCGQVIVLLKKAKYVKMIQITAIILMFANLLNLTLPLGTKSIILFEKSVLPITVIGASGYTNTRINHQKWAIYDALSTAESLKNTYIQKADPCVVDGYWYLRPTVGVDFDPQPLHTNYGTVWGLSEQYGLQTGDPTKSCFIILGRMTPLDSIDISKYTDKYELVSGKTDWQGFNIKLLKKI
jgi:4-amino-4-deoxy-L-arabinose transferase-like glycosyltransferase